jgi:hypothetical protein
LFHAASKRRRVHLYQTHSWAFKQTVTNVDSLRVQTAAIKEGDDLVENIGRRHKSRRLFDQFLPEQRIGDAPLAVAGLLDLRPLVAAGLGRGGELAVFGEEGRQRLLESLGVHSVSGSSGSCLMSVAAAFPWGDLIETA